MTTSERAGAVPQYPPGEYISRAMQTLPAPGPDQPLKTVEIDAGQLWGVFRVTFIAKRNPRQGMRNWFWTMENSECIEFGQPAPGAGFADVVMVHGPDAGTPGWPAVSSDQPKPHLESAMRITDLIAALERIRAEHGDLTVAEEKPLGFMAIQHVEVQQVPQLGAVLGVSGGEVVVLIQAQ